MHEVLRLENIKKSFGKTQVIRGVNLKVESGKTTVIVGASGSGKSTLLRCMNFLELPDSGRIFIDGQLVGTPARGIESDSKIEYRERELTSLRARIGMVFQQFNLFPHLTSLQNVMLGPQRVRKLPATKAKALALENLERVGLVERANDYPARLSGGQQQRVAIARALAMEPMAMLFDEATSALDPELVSEVLNSMRKLANEGLTMVVVTHELGFAFNVANRVVFLHDGIVYEEGPPKELFFQPKSQRLREFIQGHTAFSLPRMEHADDSS